MTKQEAMKFAKERAAAGVNAADIARQLVSRGYVVSSRSVLNWLHASSFEASPVEYEPVNHPTNTTDHFVELAKSNLSDEALGKVVRWVLKS